MILDFAAITFSLNAGNFISLPILLGVVAGLVWIKKQIGPMEIKLGEISAGVEAAIDGRFTTVTEHLDGNHALLLAEVVAIKLQVTSTNGRVTIVEQDITVLKKGQLDSVLALARLQGRAEGLAEASKPDPLV